MDKLIEKIIGEAAAKIATYIDAKLIVTAERDFTGITDSDGPYYDIKVKVFKNDGKKMAKKEYSTKIKKPEEGELVPVKDILKDAIAQKMLQKGDRVMYIQDSSLAVGYKGMLLVLDIDKLFFDISSHKLTEGINTEIIETIIDIAVEISTYGREGRKIGTAFVIGDNDVLRYTKQLVINPFQYIPEEDKNITDKSLRETIKEFAQLDGVFIVNKNGTILSAGTYLSVDTAGVFLPSGYGTKHRNCAAITEKADCIAIVISESGGRITVFKKGKLVMHL